MGAASSVASPGLLSCSPQDREEAAKAFGQANAHSWAHGDMPLCFSIRSGNARQTAALISLGASPRQVSSVDGRSCLDLAVERGDAWLVYELVQRGARATKQHALKAASSLDEGVLSALGPNRLASEEELVRAVLSSRDESTQALLSLWRVVSTERGVRSVVSGCAQTRLFLLLARFVRWVMLEHPGKLLGEDDCPRELIKSLDQVPAAVRGTICHAFEWSPAGVAALYKHLAYVDLVQIVRAQIERIEKKNAIMGELVDNMQNLVQLWLYWAQPLDESNFSLMHLIASRGDVDMLKFALARGAPVSVQSSRGITPLHLISGMGQPVECIELLVAAGADPGQENDQGVSCLAMWRKMQKSEWILAARGQAGDDGQAGQAGGGRDEGQEGQEGQANQESSID